MNELDVYKDVVFCYAVVTAELYSAILQNMKCVRVCEVSESWCRLKAVIERADKRMLAFRFNVKLVLVLR
jgi:hypothetical protein